MPKGLYTSKTYINIDEYKSIHKNPKKKMR